LARDAALGFDVGTTSVKAGLLWLDRTGPPETVSVPYVTDRPRDGWSQQDPADWLAAMADCWSALSVRAGPIRLRSIGIVSQVNTHVLVDEDLRPLVPAITWQDTRAATEAAELDTLAASRREELWSGPFTVDASFALSRLLWWRRNEADAHAHARWLLSPKDYCIAALTGEVVTDAISPVGLVGSDDHYIAGVAALVEGAGRLLPPIEPFDVAAGATHADDAFGLPADVPVAVGTMDAWGNVFGSGLVRPGMAMEVAGTSEILAVMSDRAVATPGIISFPPVRGRTLHAGPTQTGGAALDWAARCFAETPARILALAAEALADKQPLLFMPHLAGERAPHWNADARGVFIGLTTSTELRHVALAVLEGVAFSAREALDGCESAAGTAIVDLRLSGGGARSPVWNQIKADAHGRPISVLETLDSALLGAILLGLNAAGLEPDLDAATESRIRVAADLQPDPVAHSRMDDLYGTYRETYRALEPVFPRLSQLA
jgi:xylulokinase